MGAWECPRRREDGTCRATMWGPAHRMGGVRSEDSATGKAEGDGIELRRSDALRMTGPHGGALADGQRAAAQATGNLCQLEEDDGRIHWHSPAGYQIRTGTIRVPARCQCNSKSYRAGRLTKAHPGEWSSCVMSCWRRRSTWR